MKSILLNFFESVYNLETFISQCNLKLSEQEQEKLKECLRHLSKIVITFDFKLNGPFKTYIDTRYTYEQLLYLCYLKINESNLHVHLNHMFRSKFTNNKNNKSLQPNADLLKLSSIELEKKLLAIENISLCYFLATKSEQHDGFHWRQLHKIIGSSIMKHIIIYSFVFRRLDVHPDVSYVQVCGCRFNSIHKTINSVKLNADEKSIKDKISSNSYKNKAQAVKEADKKISIVESVSSKSIQLNKLFEKRIDELHAELDNQQSVSHQLSVMCHKCLNKTSMLYDRNLGNRVPVKFLYSNETMQVKSDLAKEIVNRFILNDLNFKECDEEEILSMRSKLMDMIVNFINKYRTCPFKIFLHNSCIKDDMKTSSQRISRKRLRSNDQPIIQQVTTLKDTVDKKNVYIFLRRCLMWLFDYQDKINKKCDTSSELMGGKDNFKQIVKNFRTLIDSLKYDSFVMSCLLQHVKLSRVIYLKPIKCDKLKTLIMLKVLRWVFEDVGFVLLKAFFYITDTSKTNSELFFYLKKTWKSIVYSQLSDPNVKNYQKLYNLEKIKEADAISYCSKYQSNGICLGRLLPKNVNNECRIISGCRLFNPCNKKTYSMNYKFITLNNCLNWLIRNDRSLIGFACTSPNDMFKNFNKFLNLNSLNRNYGIDLSDEKAEPTKKWNFMKFDIEKCFDSIDINNITSYVNELFRQRLGHEHVFTIMRHVRMKYEIDNKQLKATYDYFTIKHRNHEKGFLNGIDDFIRILEQQDKMSSRKLQKSHYHQFANETIYVPWYISERNITCKNLSDLLYKCLNHVLIKVHNEIYERMNGVLQGSICSRNLCDLYLGRIEQRLFSYDTSNNCVMQLNRANELILRVVDDYLVISSDYERLFKIKDLIKTEAKFNDTKTFIYKWSKNCSKFYATKELVHDFAPNLFPKTSCSSLNTDDEMMICEDASTSLKNSRINFLQNCSHVYFSWCGFNIDVNTLDVYFNYDKYFDTSNLKNRISYTNEYRYPFILFNLKFLRLFTYNLSRIVMDPKINSLQAIVRNFVDFFALSSIRFFLLFKIMPNDILTNRMLQMKLVINLCYHLNNKICFNLRNQLQQYFYSTFSLVKYLCLCTYAMLIVKLKMTEHYSFLKLVNFNLRMLNFIQCIKSNQDEYIDQLNKVVEEQIIKFLKCKLDKTRF